jgi:hypothetical protein
MHQQLWGYKVEEKLNLGVREQKRLNTADVNHPDMPPDLLQTTLSFPSYLELYNKTYVNSTSVAKELVM